MDSFINFSESLTIFKNASNNGKQLFRFHMSAMDATPNSGIRTHFNGLVFDAKKMILIAYRCAQPRFKPQRLGSFILCIFDFYIWTRAFHGARYVRNIRRNVALNQERCVVQHCKPLFFLPERQVCACSQIVQLSADYHFLQHFIQHSVFRNNRLGKINLSLADAGNKLRMP